MQGFGGITKRHRAGDERPHDGIATFERTLQVLASATLALIIIVLAVGCGPSDVEVTAAHVAAADALKGNVSAEDHAAVIRLAHPIGFAASIRDCLPSGRECSPERYYFSKAAQ